MKDPARSSRGRGGALGSEVVCQFDPALRRLETTTSATISPAPTNAGRRMQERKGQYRPQTVATKKPNLSPYGISIATCAITFALTLITEQKATIAPMKIENKAKTATISATTNA